MKDQMVHFSLIISPVLVLLAFTSVINACELATIGGGCPDIKECTETCRPCYRGVGEVHVYCRPAGAGIPYDECVCSMQKGASCNVTGSPKCPRPWPPPPSSAKSNVNGTVVILD